MGAELDDKDMGWISIFIIYYRLLTFTSRTARARNQAQRHRRLFREQQNTDIVYIHVSLSIAWRTTMRDKNDTSPILTQLKSINMIKQINGVGDIRTPEQAEKLIQRGIDLSHWVISSLSIRIGWKK